MRFILPILKENEEIVILKTGSNRCTACIEIKLHVQNSESKILKINVDDSNKLYVFLVLKSMI